MMVTGRTVNVSAVLQVREAVWHLNPHAQVAANKHKGRGY